MKFVLDNSAIIQIVGFDEGEDNPVIASFVRDYLQNENVDLIISDLTYFEFGNVVVVKSFKRHSPPEFMRDIYDGLDVFSFHIASFDLDDHRQISQLASDASRSEKKIVTHYDASYLYMLEKYDAQLLSLDRQMLKLAGRRVYQPC